MGIRISLEGIEGLGDAAAERRVEEATLQARVSCGYIQNPQMRRQCIDTATAAAQKKEDDAAAAKQAAEARQRETAAANERKRQERERAQLLESQAKARKAHADAVLAAKSAAEREAARQAQAAAEAAMVQARAAQGYRDLTAGEARARCPAGYDDMSSGYFNTMRVTKADHDGLGLFFVVDGTAKGDKLYVSYPQFQSHTGLLVSRTNPGATAWRSVGAFIKSYTVDAGGKVSIPWDALPDANLQMSDYCANVLWSVTQDDVRIRKQELPEVKLQLQRQADFQQQQALRQAGAEALLPSPPPAAEAEPTEPAPSTGSGRPTITTTLAPTTTRTKAEPMPGPSDEELVVAQQTTAKPFAIGSLKFGWTEILIAGGVGAFALWYFGRKSGGDDVSLLLPSSEVEGGDIGIDGIGDIDTNVRQLFKVMAKDDVVDAKSVSNGLKISVHAAHAALERMVFEGVAKRIGGGEYMKAGLADIAGLKSAKRSKRSHKARK